jgi:aminoglycoside 6'-N-acetyltransferase
MATATLPILHGPRATLRPPRPGELDELAVTLAADPEASAWWSKDADTMQRWLADPEYRVLVVEEGGRTAGIIAYSEIADPDYHSAGMDIALLSCCVGRGLGTESLRLLGAWLIDERGHHRLTIDPAVANVRAIHVYEKVGFRPIGVAREYERGPDGVWHDNLLMDALASELVSRPDSALTSHEYGSYYD